MAKGHSVGTVFVEVGLDFQPYTRAQKRLLKDATSTTLNIEANFKKLGIKSAKEFDLMRKSAENAFNRIKNSSKVTANDIVRAEKAKAQQIKRIQEQQFGVQKSLLTRLKENWLAAAAAITIAWVAVNKAVGAIKNVTMAAARFETLGVVMEVVGRNAGFGKDQMEGFSQGLQKAGISMLASRQVLTVMAQAQIDLNKSVELGRIAQDAAVIGNINSSEALKSLIRGIQTANIRVLRTIGINVSWEQSYAKAAKTLGRTVSSLTLTEKAQIRLNAVLEQGSRIAGSYEAAMETAGKKVLSLERHFENLKVRAGEAFTPAFAIIVDEITDNVKAMNRAFEDNPEFIRESAKELKEWAQLAIDTAKIGLKFIEWMEKLAKAAKFVALNMETEVTVLGDLNDEIKNNIILNRTRAETSNRDITRMKQTAKLSLSQIKMIKDREVAEVKAAKTRKAAEEKAAREREKALKKAATLQKKLDDGRKRSLIQQSKGIKDVWQLRIKTDKDAHDRGVNLLGQQEQEYEGFFGGVKQGLNDLTESQKTWADQGRASVMQFSSDASASMADFINPLKDDFLSINALFDTMLESMVGSLTRSVADMAVQELTGAAVGFIADLGFEFLRAEAGVWKVKKTQPALLHKDETVLSASIARQFRGEGGGGGIIDGIDRAPPGGWPAALSIGRRGIAGAIPGAVARAPMAAARGGLFAAIEEAISQAFDLTSDKARRGRQIGGIVGAPEGPLASLFAAILGGVAGEKLQDALNAGVIASTPDFGFGRQAGGRGSGMEGGGGGGGFGSFGSEGGEFGGLSGGGFGFERGTPFVPFTGPAKVHKGERIFSASDNKALIDTIGRSGGGQPVIVNVYIGNEQLETRMERIADNVRVKVDASDLGESQQAYFN